MPLVAVVLPQEIPALAAEALIQACQRAYVAGDCAASTTAGEPDALVAHVRWLSPTEAEISLGLRRWRPERQVQRRLAFDASDAELERNRSVGFALGSLAGTVAEVARLEREARAEQDGGAAVPPEPATEASNTPNQPNKPEAARPATAPARAETGVNVRLDPTPAVPSGPPNDWRLGYSLGALVGTGFEKPRLGAGTELRLVANQRWILAVRAEYAVEPPTLDATPSFLRFFGMLGVRSHVGIIDLDWLAGGLAENRRVSHQPSSTVAQAWAAGPGVNLQASVRSLAFSPWLSVGGTWLNAVDLDISGNAVTLGHFNVVTSVGFSLDDRP